MPTECCEGTCTNARFQELDEFIAQQSKGRDALIPILHKAQDLFGFLPIDVQEHVAKAMDLPVSEVLGVVTFYHYFTMQPRGRHTVNICLGTACYVRGAKKVVEALTQELDIKMGETTEDRRFSLTAQRCFGACGLAPVIMIDDDVHGRVTPKKIAGLLAQYE
ncbi:MAG: NADH-quinone oxidoreductase subunit NuoE [Victivallales bacterium]|jgi:NADH:ubiquinone oxidoreductase subunit E|nr:NADH-quinone oxidoreductase subunit NuoE [Victivallales bacterium]MBT7165097.1 NADH-quinone oxidoreductase subunit NuoE [Victivallales bacterium]MBT7299068.1 NADH-quinone oxidoreductase subunit NuoE [Victivallales bacterium]